MNIVRASDASLRVLFGSLNAGYFLTDECRAQVGSVETIAQNARRWFRDRRQTAAPARQGNVTEPSLAAEQLNESPNKGTPAAIGEPRGITLELPGKGGIASRRSLHNLNIVDLGPGT
jgi:hypothetical protein